MADLASDLIALGDMVKEREKKLRAKNPKHELMRFANMFDASGKLSDDLNKEFINRFSPEGTMAVHMWSNYHAALEEALMKSPCVEVSRK